MKKLENPDIRVGLDQTESVVCEKCGNKFFEQIFMFQKVSSVLTGTGQPGLIPIPTFKCTECGHVNTEFIPTELRNKEVKEVHEQ